MTPTSEPAHSPGWSEFPGEDPVLPDCPHCGEPRLEGDLVERLGPMETYRCPNCGAEYTVLVEPAFEGVPDDDLYSVALRWSPDRSVADVVRALREVLPEERDSPVGVVRVRVESGHPMQVHGLFRRQAEALRDAAAQHGLTAEMSRTDHPSPDEPPAPENRQETQP